MQHPDHPAAGHQRHAHHRPDPLLPQDRVEHRGVIHVVEDHRLVPGGDPPREPPAHRNPHALPHFLLQPGRRSGDQLPGRKVQQQHRGRVGPQDLPDPVQQRGQEITILQPGQRRVRKRLDVPQPVPNRRAVCLRHHLAPPHQQLIGHRLGAGHHRAEPERKHRHLGGRTVQQPLVRPGDPPAVPAGRSS